MTERDLLRRADTLELDLQSAQHMFDEFLAGCRALHDVGPAVTIFGSARFPEDHRYYELARATGRALAEAGYAVMTGGRIEFLWYGYREIHTKRFQLMARFLHY